MLCIRQNSTRRHTVFLRGVSRKVWGPCDEKAALAQGLLMGTNGDLWENGNGGKGRLY